MKHTSVHALLNPALATLVSCAVVPSSGQVPKQGPATPNIVFILADDMGYGDVGCYNPASKIPTPNMDKLASQGIRFMNAHSPAALSTPTRYGILTGRYCWRTRPCSTLRSRQLEWFRTGANACICLSNIESRKWC